MCYLPAGRKMTPPVPAEVFHGSFSDETGPSAIYKKSKMTVHISSVFNLSLKKFMQLALHQHVVESVHFIDVLPSAGDDFAICLLLFLQFQGQMVDLLMEVSVELLILQWNSTTQSKYDLSCCYHGKDSWETNYSAPIEKWLWNL